MGKKLRLAALILAVAGPLAWISLARPDALYWPGSAHERIEEMAGILRKIRAPARWCSPSSHPANLVAKLDAEQIGACLARIEPASDNIEVHAKEYMKRFYRATTGGLLCEVTLSSTYNEDRIVGSDCYYGLFPTSDDTGVGMTDDPFG